MRSLTLIFINIYVFSKHADAALMLPPLRPLAAMLLVTNGHNAYVFRRRRLHDAA